MIRTFFPRKCVTERWSLCSRFQSASGGCASPNFGGYGLLVDGASTAKDAPQSRKRQVSARTTVLAMRMETAPPGSNDASNPYSYHLRAKRRGPHNIFDRNRAETSAHASNRPGAGNFLKSCAFGRLGAFCYNPHVRVDSRDSPTNAYPRGEQEHGGTGILGTHGQSRRSPRLLS